MLLLWRFSDLEEEDDDSGEEAEEESGKEEYPTPEQSTSSRTHLN